MISLALLLCLDVAPDPPVAPQFTRRSTYDYAAVLWRLRGYVEFLEGQRLLSPGNPYVVDRLDYTKAVLLVWEEAAALDPCYRNPRDVRIQIDLNLRRLLSPEDYTAGRLPYPGFAFPRRGE
jgi:hypothetical protein